MFSYIMFCFMFGIYHVLGSIPWTVIGPCSCMVFIFENMKMPFFFWYVEFSFSFGALYSYSDPRLIRRQFKKIFLVKKENLHRKIDTRKKKLSRWKVMLLLRLVLLLLPYCYNNCYVIMLQCCNVWNYRSWQQ